MVHESYTFKSSDQGLAWTMDELPIMPKCEVLNIVLMNIHNLYLKWHYEYWPDFGLTVCVCVCVCVSVCLSVCLSVCMNYLYLKISFQI
jgi:hypothetical protein